MKELFLKGVNGQLYVFNDHIEIHRKGFVAHTTHMNTKYTTINFSDIASIKYRAGTPLLSGYLFFRKKGYQKNCHLLAAATDDNCIIFRFWDNNIAKQIKNELQKKI